MTSLGMTAADLWNTKSTVPVERHRCSFALVPRQNIHSSSRFAFVSLATQLEVFSEDSFDARDIAAPGHPLIDRGEMFDRLLTGHVGVVLAGAGKTENRCRLPPVFVEHRDRLRLREVTTRKAIEQIGLDQLTSPHGAAIELFDMVADLWDTDLAIQIDVATTLTAGADRQRYIDEDYRSFLDMGRRSALRFLAHRSIQSNPFLAL
jgi:hypothetical protein